MKGIVKFVVIIAYAAIIGFVFLCCSNGTTSSNNVPTPEDNETTLPDNGTVLPSVSETPVVTDFTFGNLTQNVGNVIAVTVTPKEGKSNGVISVWYEGTEDTIYTKSKNLPGEDGLYVVTFDVEATTGWNAVSGLTIDEPLLITDPSKLTPVETDYDIIGAETFEYDGTQKVVTVTAKADKSDGTITVHYEGTSNTYGRSTIAPRETGTYVVTFNVAKTKKWNAASLSAGTLTIKKSNPTEDDFTATGIGAFTYNGTSKVVTVTPKEGKSNGTINVKYNGNMVAPSAVGTYTVTFDVAATANWNTVSGLSVGTLTINPKVTTLNINTIAAQAYTGNAITPTITVKDGTLTLVLTSDYTVTYSNNVNIGNAALVNITGVGNYAGSTGSANFSINKGAGASISSPTLNIKSNNSITINAVTAPSNGQTVEYAINTTNSVPTIVWQTNLTFNGLNAGTTYYIFARSKENDNYTAGSGSSSLSVTTLGTFSSDKIEYYWINEHDSLVTTNNGAVTIGVGQMFTITAQGTGFTVSQWYLDGVVIIGQSGNTYNFSSTTLGKHTVGLVVTKNGMLYNTNITITVQ